MKDIDSYKLSVVVTSRNDDHGRDQLKRFQIFINSLLQQCERFHLKIELIIVEWNPPLEKEKLINVISWEYKNQFCDIKIIEVPYEIHSKFENQENIPLFQMIAKNVGIRRAQGEFVLATNIDIIFSNELIEFLANNILDYNSFYRVDRYDILSDIPSNESLNVTLNYCSNNVIRVNKRGVTTVLNSNNQINSFSFKKVFKKLSKIFNLKRKLSNNILHTNACGDFTLLAKNVWNELHGYAEFEMYSFRIDALFCHSLFYHGIKEVTFNDSLRIYHIEHSPGSGWTPQNNHLLFERLDKNKIPYVTSEQKINWINKMKKNKSPLIFNDKNWGLGNIKLGESYV